MGSFTAHVMRKAVWKSNAHISTKTTPSCRTVQMTATFWLQLTDEKLNLKKTHKYYSQGQTQIFVTGSGFCDFVVCPQRDCAVVRILPDVKFWTALLTKAQEFFLKVSLPELVACHYTQAATTTQHPLTVLQQAHTKRPRTQALQKTNYGAFAGALKTRTTWWLVTRKTAIKWFHLSCVGHSQAPSASEPWLCASCTQN